MEKKSHFKTGNICRIYIKDFLTFDEVEVRPKPKLNFIYGPNGAGKSSVLCAIAICLGAKPATMGRGKEIYDYIKRNRTVAVIEVELHVEGDINVVVKRKIDHTSKHSSWYLQGKEVHQSAVQAKIESLDIQMDNLCQYLPQDRVVEFAKLNNTNLLLATEKAIGDASLHQQHMALCESGQHLQSYVSQRDTIKEKLTITERKKARLKNVVDNLEVKEKLEAELTKLRTQRAWYMYDHKRKNHLQHKERLKEKEKELKEMQHKMQPVLTAIADRKNELHKTKKSMKEKAEFLRKSQAAVHRSQEEYDKHGDALCEARRSYEAKEVEERQRQNEIMDYKRQLDVLLCQLQNLPQLNEKEAVQRLKELTANILRSSQGIVGLQGRLSDMCTKKEGKTHMINTHMKELELKQDVMGQRIELLKDRNPDAYKATKWLETNKDKFKGAVHPPIFTQLEISSPVYARYVENRVMGRDLVAFVCEDKGDVNKLKEAMDRQKLRVNIVHSNPGDLASFKPQHPFENLRQLGFDTYMLDCINAPPAILAFLCRSYGIHNVPIALKKNMDYSVVPPAISVFYMGDSRYSSARSRYDGVVAMNIYPLRAPIFLRITLDKERISFLQEKIAALKTEVSEEEETIRGLRGEEEELSKRLEEWRNEKRSLTSRKEERRMLDQRIEQKRQQITRHEKGAINLTEEKSKMEESCAECVRLQVGCTVRHEINLTNIARGMCEGLRAEGKARVLAAEVRHLDESAEEQRFLLSEMESHTLTLKEEVEKLKMEGHTALKELMRLLGLDHISQITTEIREQYQNSSLEETEKLLAERDAHLACLVTATSSELNEYRNREKEVEALTRELNEAERKYQAHESTLGEMRERWLPRITTLVKNISGKFSHFMSRLGCAGEVLLKEDGENFVNYGMVIRVKFRDHQKLQELTPHVQSGGERAVSTALYLLALQSLSAAPFRCVDEINQGMDPVNERQFLKMLMETEGTEDSSQYFFVTPKMLPDIEYKAGVNIMVVFNSPTNLEHSKHTIRKALKRKGELNRQAARRS